MSLADELLADFEELGDDGDEEAKDNAAGGEVDQMEEELMMVGKLSVHQIAKLQGSGQVGEVISFTCLPTTNFNDWYNLLEGWYRKQTQYKGLKKLENAF